MTVDKPKRPLSIPWHGALLFSKFLNIEPQFLSAAPGISLSRQANSNGWELYNLSSGEKLHDKMIRNPVAGRYRYRLLARPQSELTFLFAEDPRVLAHVLQRVLPGLMLPLPRQYRFDTDRLTKDLAQRPSSAFRIAGIHSYLPRYGRALTSASFRGDDVLEARIVRENLQEMQVYGAALTDGSAQGFRVHLNATGALSFLGPFRREHSFDEFGVARISWKDSLVELERCIEFLREGEYVLSGGSASVSRRRRG